MPKQQGFLATFRIDEDLWGKFKDIAKNNRTNASALILGYIESVVSAGEVVDFGVVSQSTNSLSVQNIDKLIDERIKSVQNIDNISIQQIDLRIDERIKCLQQSTNSLSVQDIDKRIDEKLGGIESMAKKLIGENMPAIPDEWELSQLVRKQIGNSLEEGHIAAKIQDIRDEFVADFNEFSDNFIGRLAKVEGAVIGENKPEPTTEPEPPTTEPEPPTPTTLTENDKAEIIKALGIQKIVDGTDGYTSGSTEIFDLIQKNRKLIESKLGIEVKTSGYQIQNLNNILPALGYKVKPKQPKNENGQRTKTYSVVGAL